MKILHRLFLTLMLALTLVSPEIAAADNHAYINGSSGSSGAEYRYQGSGDVLPMLINHGIDGSWVNPAANSQGLVIETMPSSNTLVAFWFTFNEAGGEREWYIALGDINGAVAELSVFVVEDGIFDQANATQEVQWGTARIEFTDCSNGNFEYDSPLQNISGSFGLQRLTPDVSCADNHEQAHVSFVTSSNSWLDAQGSWIFDVCVDLGPAESHGKEEFRFDGASLSFDIDHYNAAGCQGPVDVQRFAFELTRVDKVMSSLEGVPVITNRVLLKDMVSGDVAKQTLYFDVSGSPTIMTHGNFDGGLDADGFPATLHEVFASPLP